MVEAFCWQTAHDDLIRYFSSEVQRAQISTQACLGPFPWTSTPVMPSLQLHLMGVACVSPSLGGSWALGTDCCFSSNRKHFHTSLSCYRMYQMCLGSVQGCTAGLTPKPQVGPC